MTVKELKKVLELYSDNQPVVFRRKLEDGRYVYQNPPILKESDNFVPTLFIEMHV